MVKKKKKKHLNITSVISLGFLEKKKWVGRLFKKLGQEQRFYLDVKNFFLLWSILISIKERKKKEKKWVILTRAAHEGWVKLFRLLCFLFSWISSYCRFHSVHASLPARASVTIKYLKLHRQADKVSTGRTKDCLVYFQKKKHFFFALIIHKCIIYSVLFLTSILFMLHFPLKMSRM